MPDILSLLAITKHLLNALVKIALNLLKASSPYGSPVSCYGR